MKWRLFAAGSCRHLEAVAMKGGAWRQAVFPALFVTIETAAGWLVVDTGYAPRVLKLCRSGWWRLYPLMLPVSVRPEQTAAAQLAGEKIAGVFLTHFHADHEGGLRDFPDVPFYASREGWEAARKQRGFAAFKAAHLPGLVPEDFEQRVRLLNSDETGAPDWAPDGWRIGTDVLSDGALWAVRLPGHAAGQLGLMFQDEAERLVFLVADAMWRLDWLRSDRGPQWPVRFISHDWKALKETLARLQRLKLERPDVIMVPFHCEETALAYGVENRL